MKLKGNLLAVAFLCAIFLVLFMVKYAPMGFSLAHEAPITVFSSDSIFHALESDWLAKTGIHGNMAPYLATGRTDVYDTAPPLVYFGSALLTKFSGVETWDTIYLLSVLGIFGAICGFFFLFREFWGVRPALALSALLLFPLDSVFFFLLQIGWWHQILAIMFFPYIVYLTFKGLERPGFLLLAALFIAAQMATHFIEGVISVAFFGLYFLIASLQAKKVNKYYLLSLLVVGLVFAQQFWVLSSAWSVGASFGSIPAPFDPGIPRVSYSTLNPLTLVVGVLGVAYLGLKLKAKKSLLFGSWVLLYLAACLSNWVGMFFWFHRLRVTAHLLAYPLVVLGLFLISGFFKGKYRDYFWAGIVVLILIMAIPASYSDASRARQPMVTEEGYEDLEWVLKNTPEDSSVFFFTGCPQGICAFVKRLGYDVRFNDMQKLLDDELHEVWPGTTFGYHQNLPYKTGPFTFGKYGDLKEVNLCAFDYKYFVFYQELAPALDRYVQKLLDTHEVAYSNQDTGVLILKKTSGEDTGCLGGGA